MYMFTQCSRQLGSFPPTLMFQAQITGKRSCVPYRVRFPVDTELFLQETSFAALPAPRS